MPTGQKPRPGTLTHHIAGVLRAEAARKQISQSVIAEATGISQSQVSKYLAGRRSPNVDELAALCRAVGRGYLDVAAEAEREVVAGMKITAAERADLEAAIEQHRAPSDPPATPLSDEGKSGTDG